MNIQSQVHVFILFISYLFINYVATTHNVEFCVYRLMKNLSGTAPENYLFFLYALESTPEYFSGCNLEDELESSFLQKLIIPMPYILTNSSSSVDITKTERTPTKLSNSRLFDVIITPTRTKYYPPPSLIDYTPMQLNNRGDKRISDLKIKGNSKYVFIDDFGFLHFLEYYAQPTTLLVLLKTCDPASSQYIHLLALQAPYLPTILLVNTQNQVLTLLRELSLEIPLNDMHNLANPINPLELHYKFYWKVKWMSTFHFLYIKVKYAENFPWELPNQCHHLVKNLVPVCTSNIMSVLTLAKEVHNQTFILYNSDDQRDLERYAKAPFRTLSVTPVTLNTVELFEAVGVRDKRTIRSMLTTYKIIKFESMKFIYCTSKTRQTSDKVPLEFTTWVYPFHKYMWLFGGFLVLMDLLSELFSGKLIVRLSMREITKQTLLRVYLFVALFAGMMIRGYYENELTSLATVPTKPDVFSTIGQFFNATFRILAAPGEVYQKWNQDMLQRSMMAMFQRDFAIHGVGERFDDVFKFVDHSLKFKEYIAEYMVNKFGYMTQSSELHLQIDKISSIMNKLKYSCHAIPERFYPTMVLQQIGLLNRYWYMKSYGLLESTGLMNVWDDWSLSGARIRAKLFASRKSVDEVTYSEEGVDAIKIEKMAAVGVILVGIYALVTVLFVLEICHNNYMDKENKVTQMFMY